MPNVLQPSTDTVSSVGRAVSDLGLASLLGGQLFGRMALHPAVSAISEPRERGEVVNAAWRRYGAVNGAGLAAVRRRRGTMLTGLRRTGRSAAR